LATTHTAARRALTGSAEGEVTTDDDDDDDDDGAVAHHAGAPWSWDCDVNLVPWLMHEGIQRGEVPAVIFAWAAGATVGGTNLARL
jgi:hypothetical protein